MSRPRQWGGGASAQFKSIGIAPSLLPFLIAVLPVRLNEDLEALFVLSCGLRKRIAAFPGGLALSSLP